MKTEIECYLESAAKSGTFHYVGELSVSERNELVKKGLFVCKLQSRNTVRNLFKQSYSIFWFHACVKCETIEELDENDENYSYAEKLWIISSKNSSKQ